MRLLSVCVVLCLCELALAKVPNKGGAFIRDGHVQWMSDSQIAAIKSSLPAIADRQLQAALFSQNTMWYDEETMEFTYQDSVETVVGVRANRVGREVGERNRDNPGIAKLLKLFGPDKRFRFPFRTAAGTDLCKDIYVVNFWLPPTKDGNLLPVKWWKSSSRGRWHWVFPVDTTFGEILFQKSPIDQSLVVYEIRTRVRFLEGWKVNIFRPFAAAKDLATAIKERRPGWQQNAHLRVAVNHLENNNNLKAARLESVPFAKAFAPIDGAIDEIPDLNDPVLVVELLRKTPFHTVEGKVWKRGAGLETYAPGSAADFNIVPGGYMLGLVPVNEVSCKRCHEHTAHPVKDFEFDAVLYGEVWGEDQIFTWHLFRVHSKIYNTFDDADGSRQINPALQQAGLLMNERVATGDSIYQQLPTPF